MANFNLATAVPLPIDTIPGPHGVYRDSEGALLLWADSPLRGGGIAVNAEAVDAFRGMEGTKFVRFTNPRARLDRIMPLAEVQLGVKWPGSRGDYYAVDLVPKPLTPLLYE